MPSSTTSSPFLRLPRELRYEVYDYLCRQEPKSYPFSLPPISSIDQGAPPTNLLVTCRYLYEETLAYFFGKVTLRFVAQDVLRIPRKEISAESITTIRQAKKIDLRLHWNITPKRAMMDMSEWPWSMNGWLAEQVNLLVDEGKSLELVTLSVSDASENVDWKSKSRMLSPLRKLVGRVRFRVGEVTAVDEAEAGLRERLVVFVKWLNEATVPASSF
ncbi:hypothetical protein EJ02DRAFT_262834 [Clathrospora elynae]|uniref:Uncharacterized protein n=1 Tax=Clathrospora elynae TaxID=706981 RepID=A0A6A5T1N8_9PLEO|nr:hypothetical protein EJ02DRAFT_262834 [Clathrospora elynae]